jgi:hypothetical protein
MVFTQHLTMNLKYRGINYTSSMKIVIDHSYDRVPQSKNDRKKFLRSFANPKPKLVIGKIITCFLQTKL